MAKIYIIGLGPGSINDLTLDAVKEIESGRKNFLRTKSHPTVEYLENKKIDYKSFDSIYEESENFERVYKTIADELEKELKKGEDINYLVPGNPMVAESAVKILLERNLDIKIISGISFIEPILELVQRDPINGLQILDGLVFNINNININMDTLITQVHNEFIISEIKIILGEVYGDEFIVNYIQNAGIDGQEINREIPIYKLDRIEKPNLLTSLYIPKIEKKSEDIFDFKDILDIMTMLRSEDGCSWDREQTHESIRSSMIEEAYEAVDAIEEKDTNGIIEELGDVLLQVIFHSQIASEEGTFNIYDVTSTLGEKLIYRHPHVFSNASEKKELENSDDIVYNWDVLKHKRRNFKTYSEILKDIKGLPSLLRSYKVQKQAAKVGFDWTDISGPIEKIKEEYNEIIEAIDNSSGNNRIEEEIGDIIFSVVNLSRFLGIDPEVALNSSINKFIRRFEYIEDQAIKLNKDLKEMTLEEMDEFWDAAKEL